MIVKKSIASSSTLCTDAAVVPLKAFLKMVNPNAIGSVKLPAKVSELLSVLVNKGIFTKEFFNLTKLLQDTEPKKPDITAMEKILNVPARPVEDVAEAARGQLSLRRTSATIGKAFLSHQRKSAPSNG
jgi:hypothetical protein